MLEFTIYFGDNIMRPTIKTVMIVEDEPDTAEMFAEMMRMNGYRVIISLGGVKAINMIANESPDVLMLDVMMPELSGLEILGYLQDDPVLSKIPVVVVSAKGLPSDIRSGLEAGALIYLTKPVSYHELSSAIERALRMGIPNDNTR
jgi:two-component system, sensor histidine kinase ChiS